MAANTSLSLTSLDFDTLKADFKSFLTSQAKFKDFNFEGSNMNVLLDVMSYNTYLNSFYLNMVASEMFLDTAQKYDSVVSHAKELNYLPKSAKSSLATVSFSAVTTGIASPFAIPKGTTFSGTNSNGVFTFTTNQLHNYTSANSTYTVADLNLYEGVYTTDVFIVDYTIETQKYLLTNQYIDIDSLTVTVTEGSSNTTFTRVQTLFGLNELSSVYFLQAAQNGAYEIVFGDGLFGRKPNNLSVVSVEYRVCSGPSADGIDSFLCTMDLGALNGGTAAISTPTATAISAGGADPENIESIRFSAPRYFATQQRALASDDYSALVLDNYGGQIDAVSVYGGETLEPKQYGRVVVALKPTGGIIAPNYLKDDIAKYLKDYTSLPTRIIIADPEYFYLGIDTKVQYEKAATTKLVNELQSLLVNSINTWGITNLGQFGSDFRYSKFVAAIDAVDTSITSNNTDVFITKRLSPLLNYATGFKIAFNNAANAEGESPGYVKNTPMHDEPVLTSTKFSYMDVDGNAYDNCYFRDDNVGGIIIYSMINGAFTMINSTAGTIDYDTGLVSLQKFIATDYDQYIALKYRPLNKDVIIGQNAIALIDISSPDVTVAVIETLK